MNKNNRHFGVIRKVYSDSCSFISVLKVYNIHDYLYYQAQIFTKSMLMNESSFVTLNRSELMAREEDIDRASRSLKAMSHPLRLKILCVLGDREVSVQDIVENVGTSQSNISQHLAILRDKDILKSRKDANRVYYKVGDERTLKLIEMMQHVFCSTH